jgi:succinyl-CoA synthetase beta subunit
VDLFEYQGKQYFARYGLPTVPGGVADTVDEAVAQAEALGFPVAIKAQVQVGGRGKAGGIKVANNAQEARQYATSILGLDIRGHVVRRLWVEQAMPIASEYYASFTLDRAAKRHLGMLSAKGGIDIEQVAEEDPEAIARLHIDPVEGLSEAACRAWVAQANLAGDVTDQIVGLLLKLYACYEQGDAELVEINPLIVTPERKVYALDAKVSLDNASRGRHPEWNDFEVLQSIDERERLAQEKGLQYIGLDGSVGIIANGAGLAMSTLDVVNQVGGRAANFLDIGGGANAEVVANALTVINTDPNVKAVLINIFGGVTRGDEVAKGIVEAMGKVTLKAPLVIRIDGTNAAEGRAILAAHESDRLIVAPTMVDAARKAVALTEGK